MAWAAGVGLTLLLWHRGRGDAAAGVHANAARDLEKHAERHFLIDPKCRVQKPLFHSI